MSKKKKNKPVTYVTPEEVQTVMKWNEHDILAQLKKRVTGCTPDFIDLKMKSTLQPVFVYGTLKRGNRLHDVISHCDYLGQGVTAMARWTLKNNPGSFFPIMFKLPTDAPLKGKIIGEVYAVDPLTMLELDDIERNGKMYNREKIHIKLKDQIYKTTSGDKNPILQTWAYVGVDEFWEHTQVIGVPFKDVAGTRVFDWAPQMSWSEYMASAYDDFDELPWGRSCY